MLYVMDVIASPFGYAQDRLREAISIPTVEIAAACKAGLAMTNRQSKCYRAGRMGNLLPMLLTLCAANSMGRKPAHPTFYVNPCKSVQLVP